jgi:acid phosphatase family membrane protein YuiD
MPENTVNHFYELLKNPVFLSAFFSWFLAQLIKAIIELFKKKPKTSKSIFVTFIWNTGGMPSSHSSMTVALATSLGFTQGINSPIFIAMFCYAALTIRDALGVRQAAGHQAKAYNHLINILNEKLGIKFTPVKEIHGHTMAEVSVGILLGFFLAVAFSNL